MKIYAIGDSWVYGYGLDNPSVESWPAILSKKLNAELCNDSCLSGSNAHFLYRAIKHLENDIDLYIIGWTHTSKFTFYKSDNNHDIHFNFKLQQDQYGDQDYYKSWGKTLYRTWHNRLYAFKLWLQQIIQLQTMFSRFGKKYLMINVHENNLKQWLTPWPEFIDSTKKLINFNLLDDKQILDEYNEIQFYVSQIDKKYFYRWNSFYLQQLEKELLLDKNGHPSSKGHEYIANMLYNSI